MLRPDQPELITAALLWDRPALSRSDSTGAAAFMDAMNLREIRTPPAADDPLGIAARAILDELSQDPASAIAGYEQLAGSESHLVRVLGWSLRCWSSLSPDPTHIDSARSQIQAVPDDELRARLTTKLIAAAFDHNWDALLPVLFAEAKKWSPPGSMLKAAIDNEAFNLLNQPLEFGVEFESDDLTSYDWIRDLAADAAQKALRKAVERRARSPWTLSIGFGAPDISQVVAAEMQARWAGAIWLQRDLQTQLATQFLDGAASSANEYASAVTLWALGRGEQQLRDVIGLAEPHFDHESADFVVSHLSRSGDVALRFDPRLLEVAVECWDLLSESAALALLDRFRPQSGDHPLARRATVLWAVFSLRFPGPWSERFATLADEETTALLGAITPPVAEKLPVAAAERLLALGRTLRVENDIETTLLLATLGRRPDVKGSYELSKSAPAIAVVRLAGRPGHSVDALMLERAVAELTASVQRVIADARTGKSGMGTHNPFNALAQGVVAMGRAPEETVSLLSTAATDAALPRDVRHDSVKCLTAFVSHGALDAGEIDGLVDSVAEAGAEPFWEEYSRPLMRAAKAQLAVVVGRVEEQLPNVLVLSRDAEARVRINAIEAAVLARRSSATEMLELVLLSGLFDPDPNVVVKAVGGFGEQMPLHPTVQAAVAKRLHELFASASREVRAEIARLVSSADLPSAFQGDAEALRAKAADDRSFSVRDALSR